ncbi:hypothetical protein TNCV_1130451 [Trichonephila clavipes]|nr:hypothetical protein TNCV_1130451 [Trichonephila clavipes]
MSSFLVLYEGDTRSRWRDGQVCPDVDEELWRLGPDGSGDRERERTKKSGRENGRKEEEKTGEREETEREKKRVGKIITSIGALCQRVNLTERHARECNANTASVGHHTPKKERSDVSPRHTKTPFVPPPIGSKSKVPRFNLRERPPPAPQITWSVAKSPRVAEQCDVNIKSIHQSPAPPHSTKRNAGD